MDFRNATHTRSPMAIDCEVNHPVYGWSWITVTEDDNPELWERVNAAPIAPLPEIPAPRDSDRFLSPVKFAYLLALTGFGDVWDALEVGAKTTNIEQYATLKAERARTRFQLSKTLEIVDSFRPAAAVIAPDVDLSEAAIRAAWDQAEHYGVSP